jgi:hypothetical protein
LSGRRAFEVRVMSDYDRGAYTPPTDEPLAFDARSPQRRRPLPMTLVASAVILVVLVGAVFVFYRSGVRGANEPPHAVGKPMASIKTTSNVEDAKPVDPQALDVYVTDRNAAPKTPTFAPDPEQPQARPARAQAAEAAPAPAVQVARAETAEAAPPPVKVITVKPAPIKTIPVKAIPAKAAAKPAAKTAAEAGLRPAQTAPAKVAPAKVAPAKVATAKAKPEDAKAATGGAASVQIGAFSSATIADQEFSKVRAGFARFASGHAKHVEPVQREGHTLYRTAFTGFSKVQADAFCAALKAAGRSCLVK